MFEFAEEIERLADIKVIGVGGAGGNAVGRMIEAGLSGVEFIAVNTDLQALHDSPAHQTMQIGAQLTKGLGSGGDPSRGQAAAEEDRERLAAAIAGADMVFVTAGMGGGTGTGAAPVIAELARNQGALTVGIVTKPFLFEGSVRMAQAEAGIAELRDAVDTLITIPNERLLEVVPPSTSMQEAFRIADNVLYEATRGIYEIISRHDHVNLDFADVRSVMKGMGEAMMGTGRAEGENRAADAARAAISSPLLENIDINGSQAVLVNVLGREVGLQDTASAMQFIQEAAGPQAHVIFGYGNEEAMGDTLQVTVIATGFHGAARPRTRISAARVETATGISAEGDPESEPAAAEVAGQIEADPDSVSEAVGDTLASPVEQDAGQGVEIPAEPAPNRPPAAEVATPTETEEIHEQPEMACEAVAPPVVEEDDPWFETEPGPEFGDIPTPEPLETTDGFLKRPAEESGAAAATDPSVSRKFLTRIGRRNIGEVEVPEASSGPVPISRSVASGIAPDSPGDDLKAPAYTRKYMD